MFTSIYDLFKKLQPLFRHSLAVQVVRAMAPKRCRTVAFRAFVAVLRPLLVKYNIRNASTVTRDVTQEEALRFYKRLLLKVHPDKGGEEADFRAVHEAKEAFESAGCAQGGRPAQGERRPQQGPCRGQRGSAHPAQGVVGTQDGECEYCGVDSGEFRVNCRAVLLTYNGLTDFEDWLAFCGAVKGSLREWRVLYWAATFEECKSCRKHVHLMLQFHDKIDEPRSTFEISGWKPNVRVDGGDYLGQPRSGSHKQADINRGFFYVGAAIEGVCAEFWMVLAGGTSPLVPCPIWPVGL